jgi:8-oxo-dGTP pyrophosphatase MutT (NUDIX family)
MTLMLEQVRERLARNPDRLIESPRPVGVNAQAPRSAAILIPMLETDACWHLLFIRRAENGNDYHSGQVAFPGGCREPGDADVEVTALREAHEEIGLSSEHVMIIGRLPASISTTNYRITSFVGLIPWPYPLRLAPSEVARAFTIPLTWLADPNNREVYEHQTPSGKVPVIRFRPYAGELLWGATARITVSLIQMLTKEDR